MLRRANCLTPVIKSQLRFHSTESAAVQAAFPKINEITVDDIGSSSNLEKRFKKNTYHLQRSAFGNLPIYVEYKDNNNVHTEIRKISGDAVLLRNDISEALDFIPRKDFKIMNESKKILIKGNYKNELNELFETVF